MNNAQIMFLWGIFIGYLITIVGPFLTGSLEVSLLRMGLNITLIFGGLLIARNMDKDNK